MNIFAEKNKKLILGRQGENLVTTIRFPIKRWIDEYGNGTFLLVHKRSQDKEAYPCVTHIECDELVWEIYASDVEFVGDGLAQLSLLIGEKVAKSEVFHTSTLRSLDATENPPEAWQSWVDQVLEATTHYPVPVDGTWHICVNGQYIDTGVRAEAKDGKTPVKGIDYTDGHTPVMSGGKVGDVSTIYADGTPLISVEDGHSVDVQINGASIVSDGVANIPVANSSAGIIGVVNGGWYGLNIADGGRPLVNSLTSEQYIGTSVNTFVGKGTLDNVLASPSKQPALTDTEKAAARERIGVAVDDVQINGASIVADGVAEIPIASNSRFGAVKMASWAGVGVFEDTGTIFVRGATNQQIDGRSEYTPITSTNLDYAVKAALTDGKGAAYTDAEKAAARERIGLNDGLVLIETIDLGGVSSVARYEEPNGKGYNFRDFVVRCVLKAGSGSPNLYVNGSVITYFPTAGNVDRYATSRCFIYNGSMVSLNSNGVSNYGAQSSLYCTPAGVFSPTSSGNITSFRLIANTEYADGSYIEVYGVRA